MLHPLLARQLRRFLGTECPSEPKLDAFIEAVDAAYHEGDADRALLERSLELASTEMLDQNRKLEDDLASIRRLELELRQADKLRAVGQLAAGIAHEINTPIQFLGDNLRFIEESFAELIELAARGKELGESIDSGRDLVESARGLRDVLGRLDFECLIEDLPRAFGQTTDGVSRVTAIVTAMKQFGRPDQREKTLADVNQCISNTLIVAANEIRYVARVESNLGQVPLVPCYPGELNQVFLNLVVNAAHAITERFGKGDVRGLIRVQTTADGASVLISVGDNGCGISEQNAARIFEPFFTTKPVGSGTGQGLAIARSIVSDKHRGELTFESRPGEGTMFFVRLPVTEQDAS